MKYGLYLLPGTNQQALERQRLVSRRYLSLVTHCKHKSGGMFADP